MPLFLIPAFLVGGGFLLLALQFRRRAPKLTNNELHVMPEFKKGGAFESIHVVDKLSPSQKEDLKRSFLRGSDFKWMVVGGKGQIPEKETDAKKQHRALTLYLIDCIVRFAELYGDVLVETTTDDDGQEKFLGSVCLVPPYPNHGLFHAHFMRSVIPLGRPAPEKMKNRSMQKRFDVFGKETGRAHREVMDGIPHWYIANLGVAEAAQGKGVGRKLLSAADAIAKYRSGLMKDGRGEAPVMYLECHDGNVPFYEKMGYERKRQFHLEPNLDPPEDSTSYPFNSMVKSL